MSKLCFPEKILAQHLVVLGKTGAGKSSALRHIVEHLLRQKKRVCIIDPKGDWWGLKKSADGKEAGFPVIAFGDFKNRRERAADVPINAQSGAHVAELIATGNRPAMIGFGGWHTAHMVQFWIDFAAAIFKANSGELYLVGDEFHNFAPKGKIMNPKAGMCLHWSNRLLSEGRGLGIVCLLASQRPAKVHNDTLTSCETLVAMRVTHASDRHAFEEWIEGCGDEKQGREVLNSVASMARGEAFVWSPEAGFGPERVKFPMFTTFDSFAPPQLQKKVSSSGWADVDLDAVKEKLAAVIEETKANDPKELRKKIADLEAMNRASASFIAKFVAAAGVEDERELMTWITRAKDNSTKAVEKKEVLVIQDAQLARLEKVTDQMAQIGTGIIELQQKFDGAMEPIWQGLRAVGKARANAEPAPRPIFPAPKPAERTSAVSHADGSCERKAARGGENLSGSGTPLTAPQQRILNALATLETLGLRDVDKSNVAVFADQSPTSSGFGNNLGRLRSLGLLHYPQGGRVALTPAGRSAAQNGGALTSNADLHRAWFSKLAAPKVRILEQLIRIYPESISKTALAELAGQSPTSSGYGNNLGNLRSLGLIHYPQGGVVAATELLFPPALT